MWHFRAVMTVAEASTYLGVSPDTLYKYVQQQRIPGFKLGNRWRLKKDLLNQWMDEASGRGTSPKRPADPEDPRSKVPNGDPPRKELPRKDPPKKDPPRKEPPPKEIKDPPGPAPGV
jgi:excisionase family DNA binding protein